MADRLEDLLRACTVRVTGGPMAGAGFFVAPGLVVTCVHVIGDSANLVVRWERDGQPATEVPVTRRVTVLAGRGRPIPALDRDYPDIAVLEVGGLGGHPCVALDVGWPEPEDSFQVFGYPSEGGAELLTPARLTYRGPHGTAPAVFLDMASDRIKPGMSGAAVLNLRTGGVCGVVVASKDTARPDGALAVPWPAVKAELGEVLTANQAFHAQDHRWSSLLRTVTESTFIIDLGSIHEPDSVIGVGEVRFTVSNYSAGPVKLTSLTLRVLECRIAPRSQVRITAAPVDEIFLFARITPGTQQVELIDRHHVLDVAETDGFFLKIDGPEGYRIKFCLVATWNQLGDEEPRLAVSPHFTITFAAHSTEALLKLVRHMRGTPKG